MRPIKALIAAAALASLGACSQAPDGSYSLRQTIADAIAPGPSGVSCAPSASPQCQAKAPQMQPAGQIMPQTMIAMPQRYPAGMTPGASQIAVSGGQVHVPTGGITGHADWRPHDRLDMAVVPECGTVAVQLARTDGKSGVPAVIYATRVQGVVYVGPDVPGQGCVPADTAQPFPAVGQFPLNIRDRVAGAILQINPAGY